MAELENTKDLEEINVFSNFPKRKSSKSPFFKSIFSFYNYYIDFWESLFSRFQESISKKKRKKKNALSDEYFMEIIKYKDQQIMKLRMKNEYLMKTLQKLTNQYVELKQRHNKLAKELIEED